MFTTDTVCLQDLADVLQQVGISSLAPQWTGFNARAHQRAFGAIVTALVARGFTLAQILAWDRGEEFERDLTTYFALILGGSLAKVEGLDQLAKVYDRRMELCEVPLVAGGVFQAPLGTVGQVVTGSFNTARDLFVLDDQDPRTGEVTRW